MTRIWTPETTDPALDALAHTDRLLIALDFDGTVSPLVDEPMAARAHPAVAAAIAKLVTLPKTIVAFVSGRSMTDLRVIAEHDNGSLVALSGSHGAQYWFPGEGEVAIGGEIPDADALERLWQQVRSIVQPFEDVVVEPKAFGFGVHTRRATPETEIAAFSAADSFMHAQHPTWRRRAGHHVLEFSARAEGKDTAIEVLREKYSPSAILFAGDDVTDEDAMRVLQPSDVGVRVGEGESAAAFRVQNPSQMAELLSALAVTRAPKGEQTQ